MEVIREGWDLPGRPAWRGRTQHEASFCPQSGSEREEHYTDTAKLPPSPPFYSSTFLLMGACVWTYNIIQPLTECLL